MNTKLKIAAVAVLLAAGTAGKSLAQDTRDNTKIRPNHRAEEFGHTLNLGLGIDYYGGSPYFNINYEFNVANNFTLAPSIGYTSYRSFDNVYYGGYGYYYRETVVPVGLKGTYYFDELLGAGPNWDFYAAATLGFNIYSVAWDNGYNGDKNAFSKRSYLYFTFHAAAEYHLNRSLGLFLDVSTGVSTAGLAVHHL